MEKRVLVTITTGDLYRKIADITHPSLKAYAEKVGADFLVWRDHEGFSLPGYKKCDIRKLLQKYDRVLYVDTDILIRPDAPNIFETVPDGHIAAFDEGQYQQRFQAKAAFNRDQSWVHNPMYFNTGVMLVPKKWEKVFETPTIQIDNFYEQTYLNFQFYRYQVDMVALPLAFNRMLWQSKISGEYRLSGFFIHYAGAFSWQQDKKDHIEAALKILKEDAAVLASGKTKFPRRIYIETGGGLGDEVSQEPVIRFMLDKFYKDDIVVVRTRFPDLFKHLNVEILLDGNTMDDAGFFEMNLFPKKQPDNIVHFLCHPTDYSSIMAFRGQIPNPMDKRIKLSSRKKSGFNLGKHVLVHPGRSWQSKTFPVWYWQEIINGLIEKGIPVALIGKEVDKDFGHVKVDGSKCLDLRDKLSLAQLIDVIAEAPVLISNDSSPIHIAGAFDNWIGLLTSCKEPHHILPFRNGYQEFKSKVFVKKLIERPYEPNLTECQPADTCTEQELLDALEPSQNIVSWAASLFDSAEPSYDI